MSTQNIEAILRSRYSPAVVDHVLCPHNMGEGLRPHAVASHTTANGEELHFSLWLQGDKVSRCMFTGRASPVALASASVCTRMVEGVTVRHALKYLQVEDVIEQLAPVDEGERWGCLLAVETLHKALLQALPVTRSTWRGLYGPASGGGTA